MKYQPQHDLIDPEAVPSLADFTIDVDDEPEPPDDAYVIGPNGTTVRGLGVQAVTGAETGHTRWAKPAAFMLVVLFVVMTVWNLTHFFQGPPAPPKPSPFQAKQALYLGVMKIDAFRRVHGAIPDSLAEAGLPEADSYTFKRVSSTRYILSFRNGGSKLEYDSSDPKERFFGSPKDMLTMGDSK